MARESRRRPRRVPREATARVLADPAAATEFVVGERVVARVYWHASGAVERETYFDDDGRMHGLEREHHENGTVKYLAHWRHGMQVGWQQQWDERGRLVVRTRFVRGAGLDAWFDGARLAETRELAGGDRHGVERWWRTGGRVWSEAWFRDGREHGIARDWNHDGKLRRDFPKFWLLGTQVARRTYASAATDDPSLPLIDPRDDRPQRTPPIVIEAAPRRRR